MSEVRNGHRKQREPPGYEAHVYASQREVQDLIVLVVSGDQVFPHTSSPNTRGETHATLPLHLSMYGVH